MPRWSDRHSRRAGAHTVLTAMAVGNQGMSVLLILQIPAKNQEVTRLQKNRKNPWKRLVSKDLVETTGLEPVTSCV